MRSQYLALVCSLILFSVHPSFAQLGKESWHWQFGFHNALDFSSGIPTASSSSINTVEGSASMSDVNTGALLFYTDGTTVWDKNNNPMLNGNGLMGAAGHSTQSALILPKPGSLTLYYIITSDTGSNAGNLGIHFSIVDMNLNGGLGAVTVKNNVLLPSNSTEKLTAVRHCNGTDFWVIARPNNSNAFNAYLLSAAGLNTTPVVSNAGTVQTGPQNATVGYLRPSPNGRRLAYALEYLSVFEMVDFDNSTGMVSNPISVTYPGTIGFSGTHLPYGIAFSPDNSKVYVSDFKGSIYQYDLSSNIPSLIVSSQTIINSGLYGLGAIQLGPDGKIYLTVYAKSYLSVINNPNNVACNFLAHGVNLAVGDSGAFGLPNFTDISPVAPLYNSYPSYLCQIPTDTLDAGPGYTHYLWSNSDTTQTIAIHAFGSYGVNIITAQNCRIIDSFFVIKKNPPAISVLHDSIACSNHPVSIRCNATYPGTLAYHWSDGTDSAIHMLSAPGTYYVNYILPGNCAARDSLTFHIDSIPSVHLGRDTSLCQREFTIPSNTAYNCVWSTGETGKQITVSSSGIYWLRVNNSGGCTNSDTIEVTLYGTTPPVIPNIVTPNHDGINDDVDFGKFEFSYLKLSIFNRWGTEVFSSTDPKCIWKPEEDAITCKDGTYFWIIDYRDCDGFSGTKTLKGFLTLLR